MRLRFHIVIELGGKPVSPALWTLLNALERESSLTAAARACGFSYRHAWELLRAADRDHGLALAILERGRGARLSDAARLLLAAQRRAQRETAASLDAIARPAARALDKRPARTMHRLQLCASHDLALLELKQHCEKASPAVSIALSFRGSVEALTELARAHCDVAGFHLQRSTAAPWRHLLEGKRICAFVLARRRQGLMVAAGNPKAIRTPADLARKGLRFINRQPGSGTRILLDRMLAEARTDAGAIRGYDQEEFTHLAVAATVASGHADAGLGIEAAAVRYGLAFIPLAVETYYLGVRDVRLERTPVRRLIEQLASPALRRRIARLPGYDVGETGSSVDAEALLVEPREPPPPANAKAAATRSRRLR